MFFSKKSMESFYWTFFIFIWLTKTYTNLLPTADSDTDTKLATLRHSLHPRMDSLIHLIRFFLNTYIRFSWTQPEYVVDQVYR